MTRAKVTCLLALSITAQVLAIDYQSALLNETVTHYENEYLLFNMRKTSDEMYPYVFINQPITEADDLQLLMEAWRSDGLQFPFPDSPINLCYLLEDERNGSDSVTAKLAVSRIFNFHRNLCPINRGTVKIAPYNPPRRFSLEEDLGCDIFRFRASLLKCDYVNSFLERCLVLLKADMKIMITADYCLKMDEDRIRQEVIKRMKPRLEEGVDVHFEI